MNHKLLELHFSQLVKSWQKSRSNVFSDTSKKEYNDQLKKIFEVLKKDDFSTLDENEKQIRYLSIDFFFKSLEFLDSSTANLIPFEIVECLKFSLKEWLNDYENYIIVTSLKNGVYEFSFDNSLVTNEWKYKTFEITFDAHFSKKLIQINLPKYLSRDYLANVVLYHELGHFIDFKYRISDAIRDSISFKMKTNTLRKEEINSLNVYFPYLFDSTISEQDRLYVLDNHLKEYFSDLFASQYIGKTSNYYLDYITCGQVNFTAHHPSTQNRVLLVNSFLDNRDEVLVKIFIESTQKSANKNLQKRFISLPKDDFLNLLPYEVKSFEEISSLFVLGWELWLNNLDDFKRINKMNYDPKPSDIFVIINNLIEKSISNFVIQTVWDKTQINVSV